MKRLRKILCEDLLIVDISVGTVYVSFFFEFSLHMLAVCNPWGWGWGGWVIICTCSYKTKLYIFNSSAANHSWWCSSWFNFMQADLLLSLFCAIQQVRFVFMPLMFVFFMSWSLEKLLGNTENERRDLVSQRCVVLTGETAALSTIGALDFLHFLKLFVWAYVCVCVCVRARWPQLRLHLASNSVCLTATGSHLWPLGCPPPSPPCSLPTMLVSKRLPFTPPPLWSNPV